MRNPFPSESRIARLLWGVFTARFTARPLASVLLHDPAASRPHDLDDPYFDPNVQRRVADVIADAARKAVPTEPPT
jgi:hypothetical protein